MDQTILVIDCVYDFIDGSLACKHAEEAVQNIIQYINEHPEEKVLYVREVHPKNHCSFMAQGGIWPEHAVEGTRGAELHEDFFSKIENVSNRPNEDNVFIKGQRPDVEQYSGFESVNEKEITLREALSQKLVVGGIATEYCVFNTVKDLTEAGFQVEVLKNGLGYVELTGHNQTIKTLESNGIAILES